MIVNFAPTGMIPTKEMTSFVPITVEEIVDEVREAVDIGITIVHLHARDDMGVPTYNPKIYGELIARIREFAPNLVICVSLSGRNFNEFEKRSAPLGLKGEQKPDMGSLTLSSLNFPRQASVNSPDMIRDLAECMKTNGIVPELEAFDVGMVNYANYLVRKGVVEKPYYINLLVGNIASAQCDLMHIGAMMAGVDGLCSLAGIGATQLPANMIGMTIGAGVRVGLEDNIYLDSGRECKATNTSLLRRVHDLARISGKSMMSSAVFREKMRMNPGNGRYGR